MLSILIPTYNYNVRVLVEQLHKQAITEAIAFEIIVIDDCSPNTDYLSDHEFINSLSNCSFFRNEINLGRTATRTKLAEAAKFENLLFLDADVIPVKTNFISQYVKNINEDTAVVFGGYAYYKTNHTSANLRYKYGKEREEIPLSKRIQNPYAAIFSGNLLIKKDIFLKYNYPNPDNLYGMDNFFCYQLYINNVKAEHIDNPIYHLGLESDEVFFKKSIESVKNRKELLENAEGIENINSLLRHYKKLKKYRLTGLVSLGFKVAAPFLKKMILKKDPNLFCLDIYRLGYICTLK